MSKVIVPKEQELFLYPSLITDKTAAEFELLADHRDKTAGVGICAAKAKEPYGRGAFLSGRTACNF